MEPCVVLGTAFTLGLRHGIDWDHIAALVDIVGSVSAEKRGGAFFLSLMYALGHALVVVLLGIAAISFTAILPQWWDAVMEKVVGVTLIVLGCYLISAVVRALSSGSEFKMRGRWTAFLNRRRNNNQLNAPLTFAIGMLHGIGAETGSQVLLIAAIGGAASHGLSLAMLAAFVAGLLLSNSMVALAAAGGFQSSLKFRPAYLSVGAGSGLFSLGLGLQYILSAG